MRARAAAHLKGNIWFWIVGLAVVGAAAAALGQSTVAAFALMIAGIFIIMADQHVDPLAFVMEDALHPDEPEAVGPPGNGATPA